MIVVVIEAWAYWLIVGLCIANLLASLWKSWLAHKVAPWRDNGWRH